MTFGIAIHGGAGNVAGDALTPAREAEYRAALTQALRAGYDVLKAGGSSIDAVIAAVVVMEDAPLFNAGRGAVFNSSGEIELDAAVMDGRTRKAGAVAAMRSAKNPVLVARAVMEHTAHVLLAGAGADAFAAAAGFGPVPPDYFFTSQRWNALQEEQRRSRESNSDPMPMHHQHGTVGAVALDSAGNLAAATSTGGRTNKMPGRIGDTPLVGAGTYAANDTCAVSATGHGELFTRAVAAHDIAARMRYAGQSLAVAAASVMADPLLAEAGSGGLIAIDRQGRFALPFNTERMYRGHAGSDGDLQVALYRE
jgi:isoaspartyl peptidase/L-asparaginase-like protein (Ntn-hydrolase superfamily)